MNFFKRALLNVKRNVTKSILLVLTFFVIGNFVIIGLGISNAANNAKIETRKKMRAVVNYQLDYESYNDYYEDLSEDEQIDAEYPSISLAEVEELAKDERVKLVQVASSWNIFYNDGFEAVTIDNEANQNDDSYCYYDEDGNEICETYSDPSIKVEANIAGNMIELEDGTYKIVDGRMYDEDDIDSNANVCLITQELADLNNLKVGDSISLSNTDPNNDNSSYLPTKFNENANMELEVIGIFENTNTLDPTDDGYDWMSQYQAPGNVVLVPYTTITNYNYQNSLAYWESYCEENSEDGYCDAENMPNMDDYTSLYQVTFLLNDPLDVDQFVEDHQATATSEFKIFDANNDTFEKLSKPLDTISLFANFIIWLVIINAIIIITLVTALTLKNREYEIGVLLSLGATKFKIILQFFVELALVAIIGFSLANVSGSLLANQVGETVWSFQSSYDGIAELDNEDDDYYYNNDNYFTDITYEDVSNNYNVTITPILFGEIYLAGLGIVLIAILIPSLMIMRFSPKKILMSAQ